MTNSTSSINQEIQVNRQKLEIFTGFNYLGSDEGSKPDMLSRIAQATAALTKLKPGLEKRSIFSQFRDTTDALPCHTYLPVCL